MDEEWRPVVGFPNYMVSNHGRVYSHLSQKFLRPGIASNGYPTVALGRGKTRTLHSLVADAFIGRCPKGMEVRHRDGNRTNPNIDNLEYGTRADNMKDAVKHQTHPGFSKKAREKAIATRDSNDPMWRSKQFQNVDRKAAALKTIATKDALYGRENWTALQRAGIAYSKKGGSQCVTL